MFPASVPSNISRDRMAPCQTYALAVAFQNRQVVVQIEQHHQPSRSAGIEPVNDDGERIEFTLYFHHKRTHL